LYEKDKTKSKSDNTPVYHFCKSNGTSILSYLEYIYQKGGSENDRTESIKSICANESEHICEFGDIYMAELSQYSGSNVQAGYRPAVVVSNNACNKYSQIVTVLPFTSNLNKKYIPTHVLIIGSGLPLPSIAMAEQITTIPQNNLQCKIGHIENKKARSRIRNAIKIQLNV
jgi:mRNA-degrading endonuclease toxin of MazEF toxin-antitoxin module